MRDVTKIVSQMDNILAEVDRAKFAARYDDYSGGLGDDELGLIATRLRAAIVRLSSKDSAYYIQAQKINGAGAHAVRDLGAVLRALREDVNAGYIQSFGEIVRAEVFTDFLDMAEELQGKGYKDAAAVIAGSVLEGHLRELASGAGLTIVKHDGSPQKADTLNSELATKVGVYNSAQQKSVLAWLALRNNAAHGKYSEYDHKQVAALIRDVGDFIARYPA